MKLCKDCKHFLERFVGIEVVIPAKCSAIISIVDGETQGVYWARRKGRDELMSDSCEPEGRLWEPKEK